MFDIQDYCEAATLEEAVAYLAATPGAIPVAGGTDVLIKLREGKLPKAKLVGLTRIPGLAGVRLGADESIQIGAATTFKQLTRDSIVAQHIPLLAYAVDQVGGPQVRNMGTLGGNIANAATSADSAPTLLAMNATVHLAGPKGARACPITDFYLGAGKSRMEPGEILTGFSIAKQDYEGFRGHYIKYAMRGAMDIATLSMAAYLKASQDGTVQDARVAVGVAAPTPIRLPRAEEALVGTKLDEAALDAAWRCAREELSPRTSWRASREFRLQIARELFRRTVLHAYGQQEGTA